ncbi:MAG TPA: hypothetical protein VFR78_17915 [Pyrinomonadaceae bacterium]|nr:hypothetical protein [Pyrinomonadaceae bacterium]
MITKNLVAAIAILLFATPAFSQFGQANNRLSDLASRLAREAEDFANQSYNNYANSSRNNRNDTESMMAAQQFGAAAQTFSRMVSDRRRNAELREAFDLLSTLARSVERNSLQRNTWFNIQRLMTDISRELPGGGGGGQDPDTGGGNRSGRMTWRGRVDDDVRIRIRGGTAEVETIGGTAYYDGQPNFTNSLPYRRVTIRLTQRRGRGEIFIEQQPSRENDYTAVVRIRDPRGGASDYEFEIAW